MIGFIKNIIINIFSQISQIAEFEKWWPGASAPGLAPAPAFAPAPALAPAHLTIEQLAAQRTALPDLVQPVRHGRPRKTIPAPAPAPAPAPLSFAQLAAQYAAL